MISKNRRLRVGLVFAAVAGCGQAQAADMQAARPYAKAPVAVSTVYDWSGFYLGGMVGGLGERNEATTPNGEVTGTLRNYAARFTGGGYAGYNVQYGGLVLGVEGDIAGILGGRAVSSVQPTIVPGFTASTASDPQWIATVTGRAGFAIDRWLVYGKGGGAWEGTRYTGNVIDGGGALFATQTLSTTRSGWLAGGGVEYAWNQNWLSRIEYNYVDFGTKRVNYTLVGVNNVDYRNTSHIVKAGLSYKFGGSPVPQF